MTQVEVSEVTLKPRANPGLSGHAAAEETLKTAANSGRLSHAWLIRGPRGIGKATLAFRFARWLLATLGDNNFTVPPPPGLFGDMLPQSSDVFDGTGLFLSPENPVFRRSAAAGHADLMTIEVGLDDRGRRRREIVAADVREVSGFLSKTPAEGGWRVVIIDSADDMNRHAANAVLKVLEEPPRRAVLLLISHNPGRLLATIRSRCRSLALRPLADDTINTLLTQYRPEISSEDRATLTQLAEGSIGRAIELAGEGGLDIYHNLMGLIGNLPDLDMLQLHRFTDQMGRQEGEQMFHAAADLLRWWLARRISHAAGGTGNALAVGASSAGSLEPLLEVWENVNHLLAHTDAVNLDRRQVMMNAVLAVREAAII